jgi:hypothetical protein
MRFKVGFAAGMATGYYLGARAGRQRYDQMNRAIAKLRRSDAVQAAVEDARAAAAEAAEKARAAVEESVDKARAMVHHNGHEDPAGLSDPLSGSGGYSSSR